MATKAQVVAQCAEPGASVAQIAMVHGVNANVVHRWRKLARGGDAKAATKKGEFIALHLTMASAPAPPSQPSAPQADLRVELRRGTTTMPRYAYLQRLRGLQAGHECRGDRGRLAVLVS